MICRESGEQVEENPERWRPCRGEELWSAAGSETEYMRMNERDQSGRVRLQEVEINQVEDIKY